MRFNQPFDNTLKCLDDCESWDDLENGIEPGSKPTISVYYPTHARFGAYDSILTFSENFETKRIIGHQLKEGENDATQPVEGNFFRSAVLNGIPPSEARVRLGWFIPGDNDIDEFFGVSGVYWTPKKWNELSATEGTQNQNE